MRPTNLSPAIVPVSFSRCIGGPGHLWRTYTRVSSTAVRKDAGAGSDFHHIPFLVSHALPQCHALWKCCCHCWLFFLWRHQVYPAGVIGHSWCQCGEVVTVLWWRWSNDYSGQVPFFLFMVIVFLLVIIPFCQIRETLLSFPWIPLRRRSQIPD